MSNITDAADGDYTMDAHAAILAADIGSTHGLSASRPGSWEAQHVRGLVNGTVGWGDEYLEHYKTPLG
jgi:hypothetical protein